MPLGSTPVGGREGSRGGERGKLSCDADPTTASVDPTGALELDWPFRVVPTGVKCQAFVLHSSVTGSGLLGKERATGRGSSLQVSDPEDAGSILPCNPWRLPAGIMPCKWGTKGTEGPALGAPPAPGA